MSIEDKIFYNESSSKSLGWKPQWLGLKEIDYKLITAVRKFQKENGLTADGLIGPTTFRVLKTHVEQDQDIESEVSVTPGDKHILYNGKKFPINWDRVILPSDPGGMEHDNGFTKQTRKRKISMFVAHWDVCLNSETCFKVLNRTDRSASIHFAIDNDGTIYQFLDMNHIAWHASHRTVNRKSVGVEISNAYYPKYQSWYKRNGFGERDLITDATVHGKSMKPFMDFYPVQKEALKALMEAVHKALDIPLETIDTGTVSREVTSGKFSGFIHHYNVTKKKIDCAGLDLQDILDKIK